MNNINEFRHNRLLSKEFDIKEATPSPTLGAEIMPVVIVSDLTRDDPFVGASNEYWALAGVDTASAVNRVTHQLVNPVGSGVVAVMDSIVISASAGIQLIVWTLDQADLGLAFQTSVRINRRGTTGLQTAQLLLKSAESATVVTAEWMTRSTSSPLEYSSIFRGVVLDEGQLLTMQQGVAGALNITATYRWREFIKRAGK